MGVWGCGGGWALVVEANATALRLVSKSNIEVYVIMMKLAITY